MRGRKKILSLWLFFFLHKKSTTCYLTSLDTLSQSVHTRNERISSVEIFTERNTRESWRNDYYLLRVSRDLKGLTRGPFSFLDWDQVVSLSIADGCLTINQHVLFIVRRAIGVNPRYFNLRRHKSVVFAPVARR